MEKQIIEKVKEIQKMWMELGNKEMLHITVQYDYINIYAMDENGYIFTYRYYEEEE